MFRRRRSLSRRMHRLIRSYCDVAPFNGLRLSDGRSDGAAPAA